VAGDDGEEALEALAATLNDLVREAIREDLAREYGNVHACALTLEDVPKSLKIRVAPADERVPQLERGNVRLRPHEEEGWRPETEQPKMQRRKEVGGRSARAHTSTERRLHTLVTIS
jgi:hypothetical protein